MELLELASSLGDSYTLKYESEVAGESLKTLLQQYSVQTPAALFDLAGDFSQDQRDEFFGVIRGLEKITFIWSETDWSDEK